MSCHQVYNQKLDVLWGTVGKRTKKLIKKNNQMGEAEKTDNYTKIIEECEYNQTSNKLCKNRPVSEKKKNVRKKTTEELRLLEYFHSKDPSWSKKTVHTAAKILKLSTYQVYKWGYDHKNRKFDRAEHILHMGMDIDASLYDKIRRFEQETKSDANTDFNKQVEDLVLTNNLQKVWAEFPAEELNFLDDERIFGGFRRASNSKPSSNEAENLAKVFKITRHARKRPAAQISDLTSIKNLSWDVVDHLFNFNQNVKSQKVSDFEADLKNSEGTADKTSTSNYANGSQSDKQIDQINRVLLPR